MVKIGGGSARVRFRSNRKSGAEDHGNEEIDKDEEDGDDDGDSDFDRK